MLLFDPIWILISALIALLLERVFGDFFGRANPLNAIRKLIVSFDRRFYKDSTSRGALLALAVLVIVFLLTSIVGLVLIALPVNLSLIFSAVITASLFGHRTLYDKVRALINNPQPQQTLAAFDNQDTSAFSQADCYKTGIEYYAKNLTNDVIAPLFYFLLFGLPGLVVYKTINILTEIFDNNTNKPEHYAKTSTHLNLFANWIPARLTASLILLLNKKIAFKDVWRQASNLPNSNTNYPIAAMAWVCKAQLGSPAQYFGELHEKPLLEDPNPVHLVDETQLKCALSNRMPINFTLMLIVLFGMLPYAV